MAVALDRLQKILARAGIASRRACEELITSGRVRVNGRVVSELGAKADARQDQIEVDGRRIMAEAPVYLVMNKPRGVMTTLADPEGRPTVRDYLQSVGERVFPVGRLDFHTSGALLFTNDGEFSDGIMHPKRKVPKTYVLKVRGEMKEADMEPWSSGVELEDGKTGPAEVKFLRHEPGKTWFEITIFEGKNQQIRRMGEATGFPVLRLARQSIAGITVEGLRPGAWRPLSRDELRELQSKFAVPKKLPKGGDMAGAPAELEASARRAARGPRGPLRGAPTAGNASRATESRRGGFAKPGQSRADVPAPTHGPTKPKQPVKRGPRGGKRR